MTGAELRTLTNLYREYRLYPMVTTLTEAQVEAYRIGQSYVGMTLIDAATAEIYGGDRVNVESPLQSACFEAGVMGHDIPAYVTGWRYGTVPSSGYSRNHRDDASEKGVSIMAIDGDTESQTDGTFELFNDDRPRVRIGGFLLGFRGADGERLVIGAAAI